ncbi:hypothetical protein T484DRAFT_1801604 [Baffinella frigidus]|nr:hypothetical protein T484DRAFT_1801604 [Cryptophyta sp. CCMP2293]
MGMGRGVLLHALLAAVVSFAVATRSPVEAPDHFQIIFSLYTDKDRLDRCPVVINVTKADAPHAVTRLWHMDGAVYPKP